MQITLSDGEDYPILEKIIFYSVCLPTLISQILSGISFYRYGCWVNKA